MPATLNVNNLTVVHAGSSGVSPAFPDVCKTPSPAGPVPIPYPNVAQSSDTADGSSTVKVDGNPIMLKNSNFSTSTGDEAGSANNVASNKIKGKAQPTLYSTDVKVDGQNVFRLTDMMLQNCGSPPGTPPASEVQPPQPPGFLTSKECEKVKEKKEEGKEIAKENSGMYEPHFDAIGNVADEMKVVFYFRQTNSSCKKWIAAKHQPKPHKVFKANTIKPGAPVQEVQNWLNKYKNDWSKRNAELQGMGARGLMGPTALALVGRPINDHADLLASNYAYHTDANKYPGIVGEPSGEGMRKPLVSVDSPDQGSGNDYSKKWITGDYDLFQILYAKPGCEEVNQEHDDFTKIKKAINKACDWDAIQHGPQAQWNPSADPHELAQGAPNVSFPAELKSALQTNNPNATIAIPGRSGMNVVDNKVTVISPAGVVFLDKPDDTLTALKCRECDK
jgi:hypothetical protein